MHIHIYSLIHYARHARMLGSSLRFIGMMLLMLLISLLTIGNAKPASKSLETEDIRGHTFGLSYHDCGSKICGRSGSVTDPVSPDVLTEKPYTSIYYRLKPGIIMVPRMNRTPKPKSVYRSFARAPGIAV
jgi:hypothetical protein